MFPMMLLFYFLMEYMGDRRICG
jgi:hypothetical protein